MSKDEHEKEKERECWSLRGFRTLDKYLSGDAGSRANGAKKETK